MSKVGHCDLCNRDIVREEYSDWSMEGCSDFCAQVSLEEKEAFKNLQPGQYGVWPCAECGRPIEDEYEPNGHCSKCSDKVTLRRSEKELQKLKEENEVLRREVTEAYRYNENINKWWRFKLERLQLSHSHDRTFHTVVLPWKALAKKLFKQKQNPITENFVKGTVVEAAYQRKLWSQDDKIKTDSDWFSLIQYLAGKVLITPTEQLEKQKHRIITIAAVAANWWNSKVNK